MYTTRDHLSSPCARRSVAHGPRALERGARRAAGWPDTGPKGPAGRGVRGEANRGRGRSRAGPRWTARPRYMARRRGSAPRSRRMLVAETPVRSLVRARRSRSASDRFSTNPWRSYHERWVSTASAMRNRTDTGGCSRPTVTATGAGAPNGTSRSRCDHDRAQQRQPPHATPLYAPETDRP